MLHTIYKSQPNSSALPSTKLWTKMRNSGMTPDGYAGGHFFGDNFGGFGIGTALSSTDAYYVSEGGTYKGYQDTGAVIAGVVGTGGIVNLVTDADDNQEVWLQYGSSGGTLGAIADASGSDKLTIFEARFRPTAVVGNLFIGLTEEAFAAGDAITDAGAMVSKDFIGFYATEGAPTALTAVYRKAGQTMQTVFTWGTAIAAATWYKVGFVYDPSAQNTEKIAFYINNTRQSTYVTSTMIAAATFPDEQNLTFTAGSKNVTDITGMDIDWWYYYQGI